MTIYKVGDTVGTVGDFDALPDGTILRDEIGAWEKSQGGDFAAAGREYEFTSVEMADGNPLTILWLPETRNADS